MIQHSFGERPVWIACTPHNPRSRTSLISGQSQWSPSIKGNVKHGNSPNAKWQVLQVLQVRLSGGCFEKLSLSQETVDQNTSKTSISKNSCFFFGGGWCLQSSRLRINLEVTQVTQHLFQIIHVDVRTSYALKPIEGFSDTSVLNLFSGSCFHLTGYNFIFTSGILVPSSVFLFISWKKWGLFLQGSFHVAKKCFQLGGAFKFRMGERRNVVHSEACMHTGRIWRVQDLFP